MLAVEMAKVPATRTVVVGRRGDVAAGAVLVAARMVVRPRSRGRIVLVVRCGSGERYASARARRGFAAVRLRGALGGCSFRVRATAIVPVRQRVRLGLRLVEFGES